METLPLTVEELIEGLEKTFPRSRPRPGQTLDEIMYAAGQRHVVDFLLFLRDGPQE